MEFIEFAHQLADAAANIARQHFRNPLTTQLKADQSPVTTADLAIETALRGMIQATFPTHGIWGEEFSALDTSREYVWVLDPIDGTRSFATGKPLFCTLIALLRDGKPILGMIDQPILNDRWVGMQGKSTYWNHRPCEAPFVSIDRLRFSCTSPEMFVTAAERDALERVKRIAYLTSYGGDAYAYGLLAGGHIDMILEAGLQPYDVAALIPVIEGMGGVFSDWEGKPIDLFDFGGKVVAAISPHAHEVIMSTLRSSV